MAYTVMIDEDQRAILQTACGVLRSMTEPDTLTEELELLESMLKDLPRIEAESPGMIHGLCL